MFSRLIKQKETLAYKRTYTCWLVNFWNTQSNLYGHKLAADLFIRIRDYKGGL